jgi:hypothetical protein
VRCERQVAIAWNFSQESIQLIILRVRGQAHIDDLDRHRALQQELVCPRNDVLAANDSHSEEKAMILCFLADRHCRESIPIEDRKTRVHR